MKAKVGLVALDGVSDPGLCASMAPGEWPTFKIDGRAPTGDADGKKTANPGPVRFGLRGQVLRERLEGGLPTPAGWTGKESATGPLRLRGDPGPAAFGKIQVTFHR